MVVEGKEVFPAGVVEGLEVEQYYSEFVSYYFVFVCYKFQAGMVVFRSGVVDIESFGSNIFHR